MARITTITCDVCGKQKGEANHWLMYCARAGGKDGPMIHFGTAVWSEGDTAAGDICSEQCAIRKLSEVLQQIQQRATNGGN